MHTRPFSLRVRIALALATMFVLAAGGAALAAVQASSGSSFRVFGVSSGLAGSGTVLLTGAIGDHGKNRSVTKSGKPNSNGGYVKLTLTKGTLILNKTSLDKAIGKAFAKARPNPATCSLSVAASGKLPFVSGTGRYARVSGSANLTVAAGFIQPRYTTGPKAGKCNFSNNAKPVASRQLVYGTGSATL